MKVGVEPTESGIVLRPFDTVIRDVQTFFADIAPAGGLLSDELSRLARFSRLAP